MSKQLPSNMTVNDAVALMLNISYLPGTTDLLQMLSSFREEAESKRDHAETHQDRNKYASHISMYLCREGLARSLIAAIDAELACIRAGKKSTLEVSDDTFGSEKLVTASVCAWAADMGFGIQGWEPPRFWRKASERKYHTEWLDILDDVIATFCEEGGEHYKLGVIPKKEAVSTWVSAKYGPVYGPVSDKVLDVITTIIRPGLTTATKKTPAKK